MLSPGNPIPQPTETLSSIPDTASYHFDIDVLDVYTLSSTAHISHSSTSASAAADLVSHGFLGSTPVSPSLAISLKTLELFRRICLRKPSFSIEAFVKVVCNLYNVRLIVDYRQILTSSYKQMPYHRKYRVVLTGAFDIYLMILRDIDARVIVALGHDTPDWHVINACPPCGYKVSAQSFHILHVLTSQASG